MTMASIGVLGAGTWGVALARMLSYSDHEVMIWSALPEEIDRLEATGRHPNLPGALIPIDIRYTKLLTEVCKDKDILLFAVPSVYVRAVATMAAPFIAPAQLIVDVAKGIEAETLFRMTEVIADAVAHAHGPEDLRLVALSGPTHAEEVAADLPTAIISAGTDDEATAFVQDVFMNDYMRVYTNRDIRGVELCGALKNIVALAAGISDGLGYGDNAKAALITRGMAEITRLGTAMGCDAQTFAGLAGIGDLIVTATSRHSRNMRCGTLIGQGMRPAEAVREVGMVVEGIYALPAALTLAKRHQTVMPIVTAVNAVVNRGASPADTVAELMTREKRGEFL